MGSHTFEVGIGGKNMTPSEGYKQLVDEAVHEYGHESYNGSISTTAGFVMVNPGRKRLDTVVRDTLDDERSDIRKWGPCGCIELQGAALTRWRKRHGLAGTRARAYVFFGWAAS